jgi:uncharacterized protein
MACTACFGRREAQAKLVTVPGTVFTSLAQLAAVAAVLALAQAIYVLLGFGAGLIAVGGLALVLPEIRDVVVLLLLLSLPVELAIVAAGRRRIRWRGVLLIGAGLAVGVPLGTFVLDRGNPVVLLGLLGAVLVAVGVAFLLVPQQPARRLPTWLSPVVGLVSGVLSGLFGTGGPPLVVYYQLRGLDKTEFRDSLMAVFLLISAVRLPSYWAAGLLTLPRLTSALVVLPAVALGGWIGHRSHLEVGEVTFRRLVCVALVVIGIVLLLR